MPYVMTTCPFCGCGCGLYLQVNGEQVVGVAASNSHPVSRGRLCVKGWNAHQLATSPARLTTPLVRRGERLEPASWNEALDLVAGRLGQIRATAGSAAVGLLGSARGTNEENFLLSELARASLGTNNIDFSPRLEALPGLFDLAEHRHLTLPQASLDDADRADLILLWQSDPAQEHPAVAARAMRAAQRGATVVEVGPRSGQLGSLARHHLQPRPGTAADLAAGLLHAALNAAEPVAAQLELLAASVASFTPERTEAVTGVPGADLAQVGRALAAAARPLVVCTRAATLCPRAADLLACLATLGAATRAGTTSWSSLLWLGRYSNSQGARDMGAVPYLLTGFQAVSDPEVRARFGRAWGISLPQAPGLAAWDMLGEVKGLFVMGDDPVSMLPDPARIRSALEELDFLAVQDIFLTATAELADVVLPGASFAEKDGTFTSAERRVQRVRQAVDPPGGARPDWEILSEISRRLGRRMGYRSPAEIMDRIASLTPAYSGISHSSLEGEWGVRWPLEAALGEAAPRLGNGAGGEPESHEDVAPEAQEGYPLVLYPDYALEAWADDALVAGCPGLARELGATRPARPAILEISPADAQERELRDGQRVRVRSRSGEMEATVQTNAGLRKGVLAIPFRRREAAARVMPASTHPETGVPGLVPCAVTIEKA